MSLYRFKLIPLFIVASKFSACVVGFFCNRCELTEVCATCNCWWRLPPKDPQSNSFPASVSLDMTPNQARVTHNGDCERPLGVGAAMAAELKVRDL